LKEDIMTLRIAEDFTGTSYGFDLGTTDDLFVPQDVRLATADSSGIWALGPNHLVQILGSVLGYTGVYFEPNENSAGRNTLQIGKTGQVSSAFTAISMSGSGNTVVNHCEIASLSYIAVFFSDLRV
jgi:hypothetical protein